MVEIVKFLARRAVAERQGFINWPIGTPIALGDLGRVSRGIYDTEPASSLGHLGIEFETTPDPQPDEIDWQYTEDQEMSLFVKAKVDTPPPAWSMLGSAELGFSAKFGKAGSYRIVAPDLRWSRIEVTPAFKSAIAKARRDRLIRRRDHIVVGLATASSYTVLVSVSDNAKIDFTASGSFTNIADLGAGFEFKHSRGAVRHHVAKAGGVLLMRLLRASWSGELHREAAGEAELAAADEELVLVDAGSFATFDDGELR